jgi:hypothetical protein
MGTQLAGQSVGWYFLMDFVAKTYEILYLIVSNRLKASKQKDLNRE